MLRDVSLQNSIIQELVADLRDVNKQSSRSQFRDRIEALGFLIGYEISKTLEYETIDVQTSLGVAPGKRLARQPILGTVLRAGLPLHAGLLKAFPEADNCFIGAYRKYTSGGAFSIQMDYFTSPDAGGKTLILADPMLATGASFVHTVHAITARMVPERIVLACIISSNEGIAHVQQQLPEIEIWTAAVDTTLNENGYIVPGLGDAGDLGFGETAPR